MAKQNVESKTPLRLEWRTPEELAVNPNNWRKHPQRQTDGLNAVLREVGWAGALLYNEATERLVDGHARKELPEDLLVEGKVPVLIGSWTEDEERIILASLDPLAAMAETDRDALSSLIGSIESQDGSIQEMLQRIVKMEGLQVEFGDGWSGDGSDPEAVQALVEKWGVETGQLWKIEGGHRLLCDDSTVADNVARLLEGEKPELMVTDPPYGVNYDPSWREKAAGTKVKRTGKVTNDDRASWLEAWELFPGSVCYVWHGALHALTVANDLQEAGFEIRAQIIWSKTRMPLSRGAYSWQHEPCWYAVRKGSKALWVGDNSQSTVWRVSLGTEADGDAETNHGTQKPVELFTRPMINHEAPLIYDPFVGSGTSLVAAARLGRRCLAADIDPGYVAVCLERMEALGLQCQA